MIWFTADTHFGHSNILGGDQRPFDSIEQMNARLIAVINDRVSCRDTLYVLGDFSYRTTVVEALRLRERINCEHVRLIRGNHDKDWGLLEPPARDGGGKGRGGAKKAGGSKARAVSVGSGGAVSVPEPGPFEAVLDYLELKPGECHGTRMVLSHYPMLSWNGKRRGIHPATRPHPCRRCLQRAQPPARHPSLRRGRGCQRLRPGEPRRDP